MTKLFRKYFPNNNTQLSVGDGTITGAINELNTGLTTTSGIVSGPYIDATWYIKSDIFRLKFAGPVKQDLNAYSTVTLFQLPRNVLIGKMVMLAPDVVGFLQINGGVTSITPYKDITGGVGWIYLDEMFTT